MKLTFWGAAGETTGSHHLLEVAGELITLDCGMFHGRRDEARQRNIEFPAKPSEVRQLILSHAHIDHCGNLPTFVREGYRGPIHCTPATADIVRNVLIDSAYIQEKDTEFVNKLRKKRDQPPVEPLYTIEDAEEVLPLLESVGYYRPVSLSPHVEFRFLEAGHILGSAITQLDLRDNGRQHRLVFSGDIGRGNNSILRDPEIPSDTQTLIMESTYGNRETDPVEELRPKLKEIVQTVAARGGKLIIPAFSVGRTQEIVHQLHLLFTSGEVEPIPCFLDSPLSSSITEVFRRHLECLNREVRELLLKTSDPFGFESLTTTSSVEESKALNYHKGPCIIISASGMCESGRILHHLRNSIESPKNAVLIVGYQAENTLGRRLVEKHPVVRIFGEEHKVRADVFVLNGFSAHANASELKDFAFRLASRGQHLRRIFLVHGEDEAREALAEYLRSVLKVEVILPKRGEEYEIPWD